MKKFIRKYEEGGKDKLLTGETLPAGWNIENS